MRAVGSVPLELQPPERTHHTILLPGLISMSRKRTKIGIGVNLDLLASDLIVELEVETSVRLLAPTWDKAGR